MRISSLRGDGLYCGQARPKERSLTFFDDYERDVVSLRHALSELLNGAQELPLDGVTSCGRLLLNDVQQSFLSEHFFVLVLRIRKAIGIHYQDVPLIQMERAALVRGEIKHPQEMSVRIKLVDFSGR